MYIYFYIFHIEYFHIRIISTHELTENNLKNNVIHIQYIKITLKIYILFMSMK